MTALAAVTASASFLIADLGQPKRFANMLRVAKPTSPMSVGSWLLAGYGPAVGATAMSDLVGIAPTAGKMADTVAAALAPAVATYTGVLVADSAIPAWHEAGQELPLLFAAGAAASAGGLALALTPGDGARSARRLALIGAAGELAASRLMERRLGSLGEPYHEGRAGRVKRAATALTGAGAVMAALAGRRRRASALGGALITAGAALERLAVLEAGRQSARDPKYVVGPQRTRIATGQP